MTGKVGDGDDKKDDMSEVAKPEPEPGKIQTDQRLYITRSDIIELCTQVAILLNQASWPEPQIPLITSHSWKHHSNHILGYILQLIL